MQRRWLIDGMNVIGSRADRWWNDPDGAVRRFVEELARWAPAGEELTVVFDRRPPGMAAGTHGAVSVAFAPQTGRDAADHEIVRMVSEDPDPGSLSVVTSDRRLGERVRRLGAGTLPSMRFLRRLEDG